MEGFRPPFNKELGFEMEIDIIFINRLDKNTIVEAITLKAISGENYIKDFVKHDSRSEEEGMKYSTTLNFSKLKLVNSIHFF